MREIKEITAEEVKAGKVKPIFFHFRRLERTEATDESYSIVSKGGATVCFLTTIQYDAPVFVAGVAICSPLDMFCKKTGRECAFEKATRALKEPKLTFSLAIDLRRMSERLAVEKWTELAKKHSERAECMRWRLAHHEPRLFKHECWGFAGGSVPRAWPRPDEKNGKCG